MVVCTFVSVNCSGDLVVGPFEDLHRSVVKATVEQMLAVGGDFTALERAVLRAICDAHPKDRVALEVQLSTATVLNRENTGAGFYTRFSVKRASNTAIEGERLRRGPAARIDGLKHGMGFILWLAEGYADCLEGYSYEESTNRIALEQVCFEIP